MGRNGSSLDGLSGLSLISSLIKIIYQLSFNSMCILNHMFMSFYFPQNQMPRWPVKNCCHICLIWQQKGQSNTGALSDIKNRLFSLRRDHLMGRMMSFRARVRCILVPSMTQCQLPLHKNLPQIVIFSESVIFRGKKIIKYWFPSVQLKLEEFRLLSFWKW